MPRPSARTKYFCEEGTDERTSGRTDVNVMVEIVAYSGLTIFQKTNLSTLTSLIIMQQILLIFWKIPTCTPLFQPALLLIFGNY